MTVSLVQVRAYGDAYKARIGSGKLATTASCTASAGAAARAAFAKLVGIDPYKRANTAAIKVSHVVTSAASGTELFLCELAYDAIPEGSAA